MRDIRELMGLVSLEFEECAGVLGCSNLTQCIPTFYKDSGAMKIRKKCSAEQKSKVEGRRMLMQLGQRARLGDIEIRSHVLANYSVG